MHMLELQLRTASGKSKSTTQKLVITVFFFIRLSTCLTMLLNNLNIKKMKFIKGV